MNSGQLVVHDYFWPDGPKTTERLLPVRLNYVPQRMRPLATGGSVLTREDIIAFFKSHVFTKEGDVCDAVSSWLKCYAPYSLVSFESNQWILFKNDSRVDEMSGYGNSILVDVGRILNPIVCGFDLRVNGDIFEYLRRFRNIVGTIPPASSLWNGDEYKHKLVAEIPEWGGGKVGSWVGAFTVHLLGSGDAVLLSKTGKLGLWSHGAVGAASQAQLVKTISVKMFLDVLSKDLGVSA